MNLLYRLTKETGRIFRNSRERKLSAIGSEVRYPREDVVEIRLRLDRFEHEIKELRKQVEQQDKDLVRESGERQEETRALRQNLHSLGREFETTVSRLTDNQELIRGVQAFVRLVAQVGRAEAVRES